MKININDVYVKTGYSDKVLLTQAFSRICINAEDCNRCILDNVDWGCTFCVFEEFKFVDEEVLQNLLTVLGWTQIK